MVDILQELENGEALIIKSSLFAKIILPFILLILYIILFPLIYVAQIGLITDLEPFIQFIAIFMIGILVITTISLHILVIVTYKEKYIIDFDNINFIGFRNSSKIMYKDINRVEMGRVHTKTGRIADVIVHYLDTKASLPLLRLTRENAQLITDFLIGYDPNYSK